MPDLWEGRIVGNPTTGVTLLFGFARPLGLYVAATRVSYIERAELA